MSVTYNFTNTLTANGVVLIDAPVSESAGSDLVIDEAVPDATTDKLLQTFVADVSQMKGLGILSDQNVTLKTNSTSVPDKQIAVVANEPILWNTKNGQSNPLGIVDVAALYVTNASGSTANLVIAKLEDPTV